MGYRVNTQFKIDKDTPPWMEASDVVRLRDEEDFPESNFVEEHYKKAVAVLKAKVLCAACKTANDTDAAHCKKCGVSMPPSDGASSRVVLKEGLYWSGNYADSSLKTVAPFIRGRLEATFVGEDGSVCGGAIIEGGTYTECDVETKLVPKKKR